MPDDQPHSMLPLTPSRRRRKVGDLFVVRFAQGYAVGRVIRIDAAIFPSDPGLNLLYFFRGLAPTPDAEGIAGIDVSTTNLAMEPVLTNNLGWARGWYETVEQRPLGLGEELLLHRFRGRQGEWHDETGAVVEDGYDVHGDWAVHSYLSLEDALVETLGLG